MSNKKTLARKLVLSLPKNNGSEAEKNLHKFVRGFEYLSQIHPKPANAFKARAKFTLGILLEELDGNCFNKFHEFIQNFIENFGLKLDQDRLGWNVVMKESPINYNGKNFVGIFSTTFDSAALAVLKSAFQQMEPEML